MKVKTKAPFVTKAHHVICKKAGEIINMPEEDYNEVKDLVEFIKQSSKPKKYFKTIKESLEE